jgi:hypothetical protein
MRCWAYPYAHPTFPQVLNEDGVSGTESEKDEPVGSQIELYSRI